MSDVRTEPVVQEKRMLSNSCPIKKEIDANDILAALNILITLLI